MSGQCGRKEDIVLTYFDKKKLRVKPHNAGTVEKKCKDLLPE